MPGPESTARQAERRQRRRPPVDRPTAPTVAYAHMSAADTAPAAGRATADRRPVDWQTAVQFVVIVLTILVAVFVLSADIRDVRADVRTLRSEVKTDVAALRSEVETDMAALRSDMAALRSEVKTDVASLRSEMAALRVEVKAEVAALRTEVAALRDDVHAIDLRLAVALPPPDEP